MKRKTVSVIIATYNGSKYIKEQLDSLAKQTLLPDEIIISDDGSSDNTLAIIDSFRKDCDIKLHVIERKKRLGFRDNFLVTSKKAQGDFIAFCDQDDIWRENKIELCSKYFNEPAISMIVHSATTIDDSSRETGIFNQGITNTKVVAPLSYDPWGGFWGFSIIFRRELLNVYPLEDRFLDYISPSHRIAHDRWIVFLGQIVGATAEISEPLVKYRQHDANIFGRGTTSSFVTTDNIKQRSDVYIKSTLHMVEIARNIDKNFVEKFPLYSKEKSVDFFQRALAQLQARNEIYIQNNRAQSLKFALMLFARGGYFEVNTNNTRWKSFIRDLRFAIMRS